jgi:N4-gp56 family major capsid protein
MANKTALGGSQAGGANTPGGTGNVDLMNTNTNYSTDIFPNGDLRTRVWSELVTRDAREKNTFAKFIGGEGSGKPIVEKRDISAGGTDKVTFTTVAPIRGQGVRGEEILKNATGKLKFGTFSVEVDLLRHAVAWTQVIKLMRFTGKTLDQLSAEVMSEWAGRTEQDHLMYVLRDTCIAKGPSNMISAYGTGALGALKYSEGLSTDLIQEAKQALISQGGQPMNTGGDQNQEIPGYLFFAPDACLRPLRSDPDYLEAITQADSRGPENKLYSGSYAKWDNNVIANHNTLIDTADGRQGSPLLPTLLFDASLNTATAAGSVAVTGSIVGAGDAWANFNGATVRIPGGGGALMPTTPTALNSYIVVIDNTPGLGLLNMCLFSGTSINGDLNTFTIAADLTQTDLPVANRKVLDANGDYTFGDGSLICQANAIGTPIGYALAMGEGALYYAKGSVSNEQIFHYDDFANSGNDAHLNAIGLQSIYGFGAYQDTRGRVPGVQLVEAVRQVPGLTLVN